MCKQGKATAATVKYYESIFGVGGSPVERGEEAGFRKQATRKILGVFWGCECETIADPRWRRYKPVNGGGRSLGGYAFWDQTADTYFVLPNTVFGWGCLNRITADFKSVEGTWILANNVDPQALYLMGAGFGKASIAANTCRSIISSMSGSFAGFRMPGADDHDVGSCPYCGIDVCNIEPFCFGCAWIDGTDLTAAYGTWSIKFNKTAANKLKKTMQITKSYTFKKAGNLKDVLARLENWVIALDRSGNDTETEHGEEIDSDTLKVGYAYAVDSSLKIVDGEVVDANGDALDDAEEYYLAELGYSKFELADDGESEVTPVIDIESIINAVVEGEEAEDDES